MIWAIAAAVMMATGAVAQDADIRGTIDSQFEAFKRDDFAGAFTFASPDLQRLFSTPENFGRMVTQGYPMVWRPAAVAYLELREQDGTYRQTVQITDEKGAVYFLEYTLIDTPEGWRISAVRLLDAPDVAV
jgi:hypothetical protein